MSISLPTYKRLELPLLGRRERVRAIIATGLKKEFRRPAAIVLTALVAGFLSLVSWTIALEAMGVSLLVGGLLTLFYTAVTLFLSSLTRRKGIAAAGVFVVNFGLTIPAGILAERIGNQSILYVAPWNDYLAVASAAFSASGTQIDWPLALVILLGVTVLAGLVTYVRMKAVEVVSG